MSITVNTTDMRLMGDEDGTVSVVCERNACLVPHQDFAAGPMRRVYLQMPLAYEATPADAAAVWEAHLAVHATQDAAAPTERTATDDVAVLPPGPAEPEVEEPIEAGQDEEPRVEAVHDAEVLAEPVVPSIEPAEADSPADDLHDTAEPVSGNDG